MGEGLAEDEGGEEVLDDVPRADGRLGAVVGIDVGDALSQPLRAVPLHPDQDERLVVHAPEARFEKGDQRQSDEPQLQSLDAQHTSTLYSRADVAEFRHIAIEGPPGVGKSTLADRLAARLDATLVLEEGENPFLPDFYAGRAGAAFQTQLFFTLARHRQQTSLRQSDLFSQVLVSDYVFERDKIHAYLNLDDNELFIYQRL